jgi:hypothetical protein
MRITRRNSFPRILLVCVVVSAVIFFSTLPFFSTGINSRASSQVVYSASQSELSGLESYFTSKYNPDIGLVAVGTQTNCNQGGCGGVSFSFMNGTAAPILPMWQRYLPFENWKDAYGLYGLGVQQSMASSILNSIQQLKSEVGWRPSWNAEAMIGFIIPYSKGNTNIAFTTPSGGYLTMPSSGLPYQLDQALSWSIPNQAWIAPDMNVNHAKGLGQIDETLYQAINLYLRGDDADAVANLQAVANTAVKNSDGSVGFGTAPYRGMYLGTFLEASEILGAPTLPSGISMNDILTTIATLQQTQSDGGIPRQYSSFTSGVLGSDDETTNAALLAFSPGVIQYVQSVAASGQYNLNTVPSTDPDVTAILGTTITSTTTTSSTSSISSTRTTSSTDSSTVTSTATLTSTAPTTTTNTRTVTSTQTSTASTTSTITSTLTSSKTRSFTNTSTKTQTSTVDTTVVRTSNLTSTETAVNTSTLSNTVVVTTTLNDSTGVAVTSTSTVGGDVSQVNSAAETPASTHNSVDAAKTQAAAAVMGVGTSAAVFLAGLFPLSFLVKGGSLGKLRLFRK